jgi:hypothetical protein
MPSSVTSNFPEVVDRIARLGEITADSPGIGDTETVGEQLRQLVMLQQLNRAMHFRAPDGGQWAPNAPDYAAWKSKNGFGSTPGRKTGEMLTANQFLGGRSMQEGDGILLSYGSSMREIWKLVWLARGNSLRSQPERKVLGIDPETELIVTEYLGRLLKWRMGAGGTQP